MGSDFLSLRQKWFFTIIQIVGWKELPRVCIICQKSLLLSEKKCPRSGHIIKTLRLPPSGPLNISVNHTSPCYSLVAASNNKLEIYRLCWKKIVKNPAWLHYAIVNYQQIATIFFKFFYIRFYIDFFLVGLANWLQSKGVTEFSEILSEEDFLLDITGKQLEGYNLVNYILLEAKFYIYKNVGLRRGFFDLFWTISSRTQKTLSDVNSLFAIPI